VILATVSSDHAFHRDARAILANRFQFEAVWEVSFDGASRLKGIKSDQKCLTILDFSNGEQAFAFARLLGGYSHNAMIGVHCQDGRDELLRLMQVGVRDAIHQLVPRDLLHSASRAMAFLGTTGEVVADIHAFVPAKPGCGASTIATNAAIMASRALPDPVLLLDYDLRLGITTFLLKSDGSCSVIDALRQSHRLDRDIWSNLVSQHGNLHLFGSGALDYSQQIPAENFLTLLDFAVRQYSTVCVDLPGAMEDYECDVLLRSSRILLVCTPDMAALHICRRKTHWLRDLGVSDKVVAVLNCADRAGLSVGEVERIIQLPVRYVLPSSSKDVTKAVRKGDALDPSCQLAQQIAGIAADMCPVRSLGKKPGVVRRFVEYFSVIPDRQSSR
jgi:Flp pilus assembly CpaE family ATPase